MRKVTCHDCGKRYNYDVDDFCPKCGAFTQPPRGFRVDASGTVVAVETAPISAFARAELKEENTERKNTPLSKGKKAVTNVGARPMAVTPPLPKHAPVKPTGNLQAAQVKQILKAIVIGVVVMEVLVGFMMRLI